MIMETSYENIKKILAFVLLLFLSVMAFNQVFRRKMDEGDTWKIFYEQKEDSIDVLAIGSSHLFGSINPAILYRDYGIASYVLGSPGMSVKAAYYTCVEALKTQSPKVIIIDITGAYGDELMDTGNEPLWIGGMKLSWNKYNMAKALSEKDSLSLFLEYPAIHNRYDGDLEERDFLPYRGDKYHKYYKGNRVFWNTFAEFPENDYPYIADIGEVSNGTVKYLDLLIELANTAEADIIFYSSPSAQPEETQKRTNAIEQYVEGKGAEFINLNCIREEIGLNLLEDMADVEHVNHKGQEKTTAYMGSILKLYYEIEDRRGDKAYESWELCAKDHYLIYEDYILASEVEDIRMYISKLAEGDYTILINVQGENVKKTLKESDIFVPFSVEYDGNQDKIWVLKNRSEFIELKENRYFDFGNHTVEVAEWSLLYDQIGVGLLEDAVSFVVFDNQQESILEARYYSYDDTEHNWNLIAKDSWFQEIWNKR